MVLIMNSERPLRVLHVITGLEDGGAEAVLYRLTTSDAKNVHSVVSLSTRGKYGDHLERAGVTVEHLDMRSGRPSPIRLIRLIKIMRKQRPDVVQTWMYHADLFGGIAARLSGIKNVFWGLHNGSLDYKSSRKNTIFVSRINRSLSKFLPRMIISCSQHAAEVHKSLGYRHDKFKVIANGYILTEYFPDNKKRDAIRRELSLSNDVPVLGMVARFDPQKDHETLLKALALLKDRVASFRFLLIGDGMVGGNSKIVSEIESLDLENEIVLMGRRNDIPSIMNALDLHILSSSSEAFPNVLCEAMACGTPCVTTDVGDAAFIIGNTGWVVPPRTPISLADTIYKSINEMQNVKKSFKKREMDARERILDNFSVQMMVANYTKVWRESSIKE